MHNNAAAWRVVAALFAALTLVLQSVAASMAAGPVRVDAFGNALCIGGTVHGEPGQGGPGHGTLPDCCALGCVASAAPPALLPDAVIPAPAVQPNVEVIPVRDFVRPADAHDPKSPRAPPMTP